MKTQVVDSQAVTEVFNMFRGAYLAAVQGLAEEFRPRFESGEMHGYGWAQTREEELEEDREVGAGTLRPMQMEEIIQERIPDARTAFLILAASNAGAEELTDCDISYATSAAAECMTIDTFRLARERGWWKPRPGEYIGATECVHRQVA